MMQLPLGAGTETALLAAAVLYMAKATYELVSSEKQRRKNGANQNGHTPGCILSSPDGAKLRTIEIADRINHDLQPKFVEQTAILREIRDGLIKVKGIE